MEEIRILGAGPSGLSAAINLAKKGYSVKVFERSARCGSRFRGDLQGLENWTSEKDVVKELEGINIKVNFECDPFRRLLFTNSVKDVELDFKRPLFYLVKRGGVEGSIDNGLKEEAESSGVEIEFNSKADVKDVDIVASGPNPKEILGAIDRGIVFSTEAEDMAVGLINDRMAYKGYSYLLITKGYGCISTVVMDKTNLAREQLDKSVEYFKGRFELEIKNPRRMAGIIGFSIKNRFEREGKRYVGEAGGIQEMLWGFGIRSALYSGYLAAKSISESIDYAEIASKKFKKYLMASVVNRYLWERAGEKDYGFMLDRLNKAKNPMALIRSLYTYRLIHKVLFPIARYKMGKKYRSINGI